MYGAVFVERNVVALGSRRPVNCSEATLTCIYAIHYLVWHPQATNSNRFDNLLRRRAFPRTAPRHPGARRRPIGHVQTTAAVIEHHVRVVVMQRDREASALEKINCCL